MEKRRYMSDSQVACSFRFDPNYVKLAEAKGYVRYKKPIGYGWYYETTNSKNRNVTST